MTGPLADVRVLDLTSVVMGPLATQILGDLGADVISVEDIGGDTNRFMGPGPHPQLSGVVAEPAAQQAQHLARPQAPRRPRGVPAAGRARRHRRHQPASRPARPAGPRLRRRARPQARHHLLPGAGLAHRRRPTATDPRTTTSSSRPPGSPTRLRAAGRRARASCPRSSADKVSGLTIVYAVLAALHHRDRTGEGQRVEVPMVRGDAGVHVGRARVADAIPEPPLGRSRLHRGCSSPNRRPQRTADGWIHMLPYSRPNYVDLFTPGGRDRPGRRPAAAEPGLALGERADSAVRRRWSTCCATRTTDEWLDVLRRARHPVPARSSTSTTSSPASPSPSTRWSGRTTSSRRGVRFDAHARRRCAAMRRSSARTATRCCSKPATPPTRSLPLRECGALRSKP